MTIDELTRRLRLEGLGPRGRQLVLAEVLAAPLARRSALGPSGEELARSLALARALLPAHLPSPGAGGS